MKMALIITEHRDAITFGLAFFIAACGYLIGFLTKRDALKAERDECERLRQVIFNSGQKKTPESDVSGNLSRIQEPAHRWNCEKQGHQLSRTISRNRHIFSCRRCDYSIGGSR